MCNCLSFLLLNLDCPCIYVQNFECHFSIMCVCISLRAMTLKLHKGMSLMNYVKLGLSLISCTSSDGLGFDVCIVV